MLPSPDDGEKRENIQLIVAASLGFLERDAHVFFKYGVDPLELLVVFATL